MMQAKRWMGTALAALFTVFTACGDDQLGPVNGSQELSNSEVADVAEVAADAIDGILDAEFAARPSVVAMNGSGEVAFSAAPVTTTFSFTRERTCRNGGTVVVQAEGTHVADRETGEVTLDIEGSKTITDCAHRRGDLVVTINGQGTFQAHRMKVNGKFSGLQTFDAEGSFEWETSDGRTGSCSYEIHVVWDPETRTKTITGFVCDREINRTVMRDRSAGDDSQSDG